MAFSFVRAAFGVTSDIRLLYLYHMYRENLAFMGYRLPQHRGFMAVIAEPGMGKPTPPFQLLQDHPESLIEAVFPFQSYCSSFRMLQYILYDLGIEQAPPSPV